MRWSWLLTGLLFWAGCSTPSGLLVEGNKAFREGDLKAAEGWYSRALEREDSRAAAGFNLGVVALQAGNPAGARPFLQQAVKDYPDDAWVRLQLAVCARALGDPTGSQEQLEKALLLNPRMGRAWLESARNQADLGDFEGAIRRVEKAFADPATEPEARLSAARWKVAAGRSEEALTDYRGLTKTHPYLAEPYAKLGLHMLNLGDPSAEGLLARALKIDIEQPEALLGLGRLLEARGDRASAAKVYERALSLPETVPDDEGWRARARSRLEHLASR